MHRGVALTSAPRSRAHVHVWCAAWRRTQRQMSERANVATARERDHREFKATKAAFETAENTHFTKQAAS